MKNDCDKIQFESRAEVGAVLNMAEQYLKDHPDKADNETIQEFYNLIDYMEMVW